MNASILVAVPKPARTTRVRKPLRKVNARRRRAALAEDFGDLAVFVRRLPCLVVGCTRSPVDAAHVRSRGAGHHAWLVVDGERVGNIVPLCRLHHDEQGQRGVTNFEAKHDLCVRLPLRECSVVGYRALAEAAKIIGEAAKGGAA
jgi:hypothetical protein